MGGSFFLVLNTSGFAPQTRFFRVSYLLIEERLDGPRLNTMDVFSIASDEGRKALGTMKAIAYVDINAEGTLMKFAETVAIKRSLPVRIFATIAEAEGWLMGKVANSL